MRAVSLLIWLPQPLSDSIRRPTHGLIWQFSVLRNAIECRSRLL